LVRRADVVRSEHRPFRIEPERGQLPENVSEVGLSKEAWDVLQEREGRSNSAKNVGGSGPHVPRVFLRPARARDAERLAWETGRHEIHASSEAASVAAGEGSDVAEDGRGIQVPATNV